MWQRRSRTTHQCRFQLLTFIQLIVRQAIMFHLAAWHCLNNTCMQKWFSHGMFKWGVKLTCSEGYRDIHYCMCWVETLPKQYAHLVNTGNAFPAGLKYRFSPLSHYLMATYCSSTISIAFYLANGECQTDDRHFSSWLHRSQAERQPPALVDRKHFKD